MKAMTHDRYTDPSGLTLSEMPTPSIEPNQVLIRVRAAALNAYDWHMYRGDPRIMRLSQGLKVKEPRIMGADLAGVIEKVGDNVQGFSKGDRILAEPGRGALAEFAVAGDDAIARISDKVDFEVAAAAPMGALTSLQALRDTAALQAGERVLVWGASGGVGHLAVQVARALSANHVDAVCSGRNAAMVRDLGADQVFDYTTGDLPGEADKYDVILDTVATQPIRKIRRLLAPEGRYVTAGALGGGKLLGPLTPMVRRVIAAKALRVNSRGMLAHGNAADFAMIAGWLGDGTLRPVIQGVYPLDETAEACRELEAGHVAGKLVIAVA